MKSFIRSTLIQEADAQVDVPADEIEASFVPGQKSPYSDYGELEPPTEDSKQELVDVFSGQNGPLFDQDGILLGYFKVGDRVPTNVSGRKIKEIRTQKGGLLARRNDSNTAWIVGKFRPESVFSPASTSPDSSYGGFLDPSLSGKRFGFIEGGHPYVYCLGRLPSGKVLLSALRDQHGPLALQPDAILNLAASKVKARPASEWLSQKNPTAEKDASAVNSFLPGSKSLDAKINKDSGFMVIEYENMQQLKSPMSHATQAALDAANAGEVCCYQTQEGEAAFSGKSAMKKDILYAVLSEDDKIRIFVMRRISYCLMRQPAWLAWPTVGVQLVLAVGGAILGSFIGPEGTAAGGTLGASYGRLAGMALTEVIANVVGALIDMVPYLVASTYFGCEYLRTKDKRYLRIASAALFLAAINLIIDMGLPIGIEQIAKSSVKSKAALYLATFISTSLVVIMAEIKIITPAVRNEMATTISELAASPDDIRLYETDVKRVMGTVQSESDLGLSYQFGSASGASVDLENNAPL